MWSEAAPPTVAQIRDAFGIEVGTLRPQPGGFEADAFTDGRWFVKLWRGKPDSDTELAMTAVLAAGGIPVPAAQQALDGAYTAPQHGRRYALFPFVEGRPGTWDDTDQIARAMRAVHEIQDIDAPSVYIEEWCIEALRDRLDHPWIAGRRDEMETNLDRLEAVIEQARSTSVPHVLCHRDMFPHNVLVDPQGRLSALLDWGQSRLAPREHDLFAALCGPNCVRFLRTYDAQGLNRTHLEYARLARSLRDIAVRVQDGVDLEGINTWGFEGLRRVDADLVLAAPFCAS